MSNALDVTKAVGIIGAGTMGAGIAQVAAAAGHIVFLYDAAPSAAQTGKERVAKSLDTLVTRGRMERDAADALVARIKPITELAEMAAAALVVEVIVENLDIKQQVLRNLEAILSADAIIASNTSSISITAIARGATHPERVVGMHFFNPAPVMKLVEVVSGVATAPHVAEQVFATAKAWSKVAVHAKSTPGFIVNRVARPYYAEALRLHEEQVADPATIDALLTEGAGFRMGPFALMDLIGHDVNYAVSKSVFEAYYAEPRFRPSILQLELVNAGHLGRKSGRGFFDYSAGAEMPVAKTEKVDASVAPFAPIDLSQDIVIDGVRITRTDGRTAAQREIAEDKPCLLIDMVTPQPGKRIGFATSPGVSNVFRAQFVATLSEAGLAATHLPDWPGLVATRTVAMLANEAFEANMQGVATPDGIDDAMRFGVNYPQGPMAWAREIGLAHILSVLDTLHTVTGDPRYRAALSLRLAAQ